VIGSNPVGDARYSRWTPGVHLETPEEFARSPARVRRGALARATGRSEQQIDDWRLELARTRKSHRSEPADRALLDNRFDVVVARPQAVNQSFRLCVARYRYCQVSVAREPRFGAR
jgi:hypothetical protein